MQLSNYEEYNGLELWRNLFVLFSGTNKTAVNVSGLQHFMSFAKCESEAQLLKHISEWVAALTKYGGHLRQDEATLRALFLGLLPKTYENKLKPKIAKYPTWRHLHQYCKDQLEHVRDQKIADAIHGKKSNASPRRGFVNALGENSAEQQVIQSSTPATAQAPSMQDLANMISAMGPNAGRRPNPRKTGPGNGARARKFFRFFFKGCWECRKEGHSRHECEVWKKLLAANNSKPPAGHKGAKDRAYLKWKEERDAKKKKEGRVAALTGDEGTEDDDDEWEDDDSDGDQIFSFIDDTPWQPVSTGNGRHRPGSPKPATVATGQANFEHPNYFREIQDVDEDDDQSTGQDEFDFLHNVAHRIQLGKKLPQSKRKGSMKNAQNLEQIRQVMRPLPKDPQVLNQLMRLCPQDEKPLAPGEFWCMADTGSTLHAINVEKEIPKYAHLVRKIPNHKKGKGAECANGGRLQIKGDIRLKGRIDDEIYTVPFKDMDVSMPIASMPQVVANGSDLLISLDGAKIMRKDGREIQLHERKGVYFFKMALLPPSEQPTQDDKLPASPFGRHA